MAQVFEFFNVELAKGNSVLAHNINVGKLLF
jgi:hypothetical protein